MLRTKVKMTALIGAIVILAMGGAVLSWQQISHTNNGGGVLSWQRITNRNDTLNVLENTPPQVRIVPTKFARKSRWGTVGGGKLIGYNWSLDGIIAAAYGLRSPYRIVARTKLPLGHYDFIANLATNSRGVLQKELQSQFGVAMKRERREANVLLLTVKQ